MVTIKRKYISKELEDEILRKGGWSSSKKVLVFKINALLAGIACAIFSAQWSAVVDKFASGNIHEAATYVIGWPILTIAMQFLFALGVIYAAPVAKNHRQEIFKYITAKVEYGRRVLRVKKPQRA